MSKLRLTLLIALAGHSVLTSAEGLKCDWEYTIQYMESNTTNKDAIDLYLRPVRISPGVYGINGTISVKIDVDNEYLFELHVFRSATGSSKYVLTPFRIPKTHFYSYMNKMYKQFLMNDAKDCSNLPRFEGIWDKPFVKQELYVNSCIIKTDSMPLHMQPGYYKLILMFEGPSVRVVLSGVVIVKTLNKV